MAASSSKPVITPIDPTDLILVNRIQEGNPTPKSLLEALPQNILEHIFTVPGRDRKPILKGRDLSPLNTSCI